jgi:hypothetical protein
VSAATTTATTPAVATPDLSTVSLVYVASLLESEYTLNAKANFFNETRPGMKGNFRDFQLAGKCGANHTSVCMVAGPMKMARRNRNQERKRDRSDRGHEPATA